jgi:hypothetical protein
MAWIKTQKVPGRECAVSQEQDWSNFNLGTPAIYCIKICGYLDAEWSNRLGGMTIQHTSADGKTTITDLQGEMVDQAALFGVLNSLYGLGFPILAVECNPSFVEEMFKETS